MTSLITIWTWCPNSFQLRLAQKTSSCLVFSGMRIRKLERRVIHLFLFAGIYRTNDSNCVGRRNSSVNALGGWSETDDVSEKSVDSKGKQSIPGIVVAGAAGVILVTALTFSALCIGKRNSTRVKQQMDPLTARQEISMASDNHDDTVEDGKSLENSQMEKVLQALPGKILVPAAVDQVQDQALAALQVLKVIEPDVQPGDLCTRREYARWLVSASSVLSRFTLQCTLRMLLNLPLMILRLMIQTSLPYKALAEAGLISSKLSRCDNKSSSYPDESPFFFTPESPLSRQDLVSWKMALEKRQFPVVDQKSLQKVSGWIDTGKIHPDAWPALVADLSSGEWGIIALAFGYTRLFQPYKPVTKGQAAIALPTGEASDTIVEELSRIEAESIAEKAVASYNSLAAQIEKDVNATFEKEIILEKKRVDTVKNLAEEARQELESLRAEREAEHLAVMKERAAVDSELEVLSRFRREVEVQLQSLKSDKIDISYEKEILGKFHRDAEIENQEIARLQYELEVERKALSMARAWAEDEAKRASERAKTLEAARDRWERQGINKVVVDNDLQEDLNIDVTWLSGGNQSVEESMNRTESLMDKLKEMADTVRGKSKETIHKIMEKILFLTSVLKEWAVKNRHTNGRAKG